MYDLDTVSGALSRVETIITNGVNALTEQSIHEYTAPTNLNAIYMVDERTANSPILKDLLGLQLSITTARVAQSFELRNTVRGISVIEHIKSARLGYKENKSLFKRIFGLETIDVVEGQEEPLTTAELIKIGSFNTKEVNIIKPDETTEVETAVANEAKEDDKKDKDKKDKDKSEDGVKLFSNTKNLISDASDVISNFAVGSLFEVSISDKKGDNTQTATITLAMRISPIAVKPDVVKSILEIGSYKNSFLERWYSYKAGDLSLMQFITMSDIVEQQVATLLKDKSGYYREVLSRQKENYKFGIKSLLSKKQVERSKTIGGLIIDADTLAEAEVSLGGSFDNAKIRNQVFTVTSAATICVIDGNWETVKIYYRGIDYVETYTFNQIRRTGKGGVSVEDMLEAFRRGGAPKL